MKSHVDILAVAPEGLDPRLRLVLVTRAADVSYSEIERTGRLPRGSISSHARGMTYGYPRLREAIVRHLADALGADEAMVRNYLFPADQGAAVP